MATPISLFRSMGVGSVVVISPVSVCISTSPFIFNIIMNAQRRWGFGVLGIVWCGDGQAER